MSGQLDNSRRSNQPHCQSGGECRRSTAKGLKEVAQGLWRGK